LEDVASKPGSLLKSSIPIRTFADWQEARLGFLGVDLVPHCSESDEGFYLNTLSAVDVPVAGRNVLEYEERDSGKWVVLVSAYLFPSWGWTQIMVASLSISTCIIIASA